MLVWEKTISYWFRISYLLGFNGAETNCGIAHILGILLMNSYEIKKCSEATIIWSLSPLNWSGQLILKGNLLGSDCARANDARNFAQYVMRNAILRNHHISCSCTQSDSSYRIWDQFWYKLSFVKFFKNMFLLEKLILIPEEKANLFTDNRIKHLQILLNKLLCESRSHLWQPRSQGLSSSRF